MQQGFPDQERRNVLVPMNVNGIKTSMSSSSSSSLSSAFASGSGSGSGQAQASSGSKLDKSIKMNGLDSSTDPAKVLKSALKRRYPGETIGERDGIQSVLKKVKKSSLGEDGMRKERMVMNGERTTGGGEREGMKKMKIKIKKVSVDGQLPNRKLSFPIPSSFLSPSSPASASTSASTIGSSTKEHKTIKSRSIVPGGKKISNALVTSTKLKKRSSYTYGSSPTKPQRQHNGSPIKRSKPITISRTPLPPPRQLIVIDSRPRKEREERDLETPPPSSSAGIPTSLFDGSSPSRGVNDTMNTMRQGMGKSGNGLEGTVGEEMVVVVPFLKEGTIVLGRSKITKGSQSFESSDSYSRPLPTKSTPLIHSHLENENKMKAVGYIPLPRNASNVSRVHLIVERVSMGLGSVQKQAQGQGKGQGEGHEEGHEEEYQLKLTILGRNGCRVRIPSPPISFPSSSSAPSSSSSPSSPSSDETRPWTWKRLSMGKHMVLDSKVWKRDGKDRVEVDLWNCKIGIRLTESDKEEVEEKEELGTVATASKETGSIDLINQLDQERRVTMPSSPILQDMELDDLPPSSPPMEASMDMEMPENLSGDESELEPEVPISQPSTFPTGNQQPLSLSIFTPPSSPLPLPHRTCTIEVKREMVARVEREERFSSPAKSIYSQMSDESDLSDDEEDDEVVLPRGLEVVTKSVLQEEVVSTAADLATTTSKPSSQSQSLNTVSHSRTPSSSQPHSKSKSKTSVSDDFRVPPVPESLDMHALLATTLVFSGMSATGRKDVVKNILETQPSLRELGNEAVWDAWTLAGLTTSPMFGCVDRKGKDSAGKPLLPLYFYIPAEDPDTSRAAELGSLVRPLRGVQARGGKAIDWRPVGRRSRA